MFPFVISKAIIMAELYHGTNPREALTLNFGTNVRLLTFLFSQFLQNQL